MKASRPNSLDRVHRMKSRAMMVTVERCVISQRDFRATNEILNVYKKMCGQNMSAIFHLALNI